MSDAKNDWQRARSGMRSLNAFLTFILSSPSRRRNLLTASYVSCCGINQPLLCNIIKTEVKGVLFCILIQIPQPDCERATRSPVCFLDVLVLKFELHAMKKLLWCVLSGSVMCQAQ